jgi:hypothetical protein
MGHENMQKKTRLAVVRAVGQLEAIPHAPSVALQALAGARLGGGTSACAQARGAEGRV